MVAHNNGLLPSKSALSTHEGVAQTKTARAVADTIFSMIAPRACRQLVSEQANHESGE
jgi:hypothetical protein